MSQPLDPSDDHSVLATPAEVFHGAQLPLRATTVSQPTLGAGEILVRVSCCTICGSDLHTYLGHRSAPTPCVLGHEIVGRIEDWGGAEPPYDHAGRPLARGQRVTWSMAVGCGRCFYCDRGLPQKCEQLFKYGHEAINPQRGATGGLAKWCHLVSGTPVFSLPDQLPDCVAAPANCATATCAAAIRIAASTQRILRSTVLVSGMGMLGLTACAMLSEYGASEIIAVDTNPDRLRLANQFGATRTTSPDALSEMVAICSDDRGVDFAFDFSGVLKAVSASIESVRVGGVVILVGTVFPTEGLLIHPEQIVRRMLTIRGIHNYAPEDLADAIKFLDAFHRRYPFDELVVRSYPLHEANQAFEDAVNNQPVRVSITP